MAVALDVDEVSCDATPIDGLRGDGEALDGVSGFVARFRRVLLADLDAHEALGADGVAEVLASITACRRVLDGREIACNRALDALADAGAGIDPDRVHAGVTGRSSAAAGRSMRRARAAVAAPSMVDGIEAGVLGGEHLDAFTDAVASLPDALRDRLRALEPELARLAIDGRWSVARFRDRLRAEVRRIEGDDGRARLARQRRDTGLRTWTDREGMWRIAGRFDPASAIVLQQRLAHQLEVRFRQARPPECPTDPLAGQDWLRAHALADLMAGLAGGVGQPEFIVVIDHDTLLHGRHDRSRVDCGAGLEVPVEELLALAGRARFIPVLLDADGVVVAQGRPVRTVGELLGSIERPVVLDHGRARRHASRVQRRALRAMYRSCGVPGCEQHVSLTEPHHVEFWEHGGATDLHLLLPLCRHHHDRLHRERWDVHLAADRSLTVRRDGQVIMTTGPPAEQWA